MMGCSQCGQLLHLDLGHWLDAHPLSLDALPFLVLEEACEVDLVGLEGLRFPSGLVELPLHFPLLSF